MGQETGSPPSYRQGSLTAEDVRAYLRKHPDFLVQNPDLVHHLTPPSQDYGRGVVDLQVYMVEKLRADVHKLKTQQRELVGTSRANMHSQNRIHSAVLFLLDAQSFEHLIQTITTDLAVLLDLDVACLVVESNGHDTPHVQTSGVRVVEAGLIDQFMGHADVLLHSNIQGDPALYGHAAEWIRSEALIRLNISSETPEGMLVFGARDPDAFQPEQGTELIGFLSRVIERVIRGWLELPS